MPIPALTPLVDGDVIYVAPLNSNFSALRNNINSFVPFKNETATIAAVWTFTTTPVFASNMSVAGTITVANALSIIAGGLNVNQGGAAIVGDVAVTGSVTASGTLSGANLATAGVLSAAGATLSGNLAGTSGIFSSGVQASSFTGIGTSLTALAAANITAGGTLPALNGAALTALNATQITTGTLDQARIATALGTRTFTSVSTTTLVAGGSTLGATVVASLDTSARLNVTLGGSADTAEVLSVDDAAISLSPGAGSTKYLRVRDAFGAIYKITMQAVS